jgi:hypothetical protein
MMAAAIRKGRGRPPLSIELREVVPLAL